MIREKFSMQTELVASEDGLHTYEVLRSWSDRGKKGLVLELYPTLSAGRCGELDLSTMHLLNHTKDFGWGTVRIINLYSIVCSGKPKVSQLHYEQEAGNVCAEACLGGDRGKDTKTCVLFSRTWLSCKSGL